MAKTAADTVAHDRRTDGLGSDETKSGGTNGAGSSNDHKPRPARAPARFLDALIIDAVANAVLLGKQRSALGGKALAALPAASGEDGATSAGAHAQTETVHLCPTTVVGLKRALAHDEILLEAEPGSLVCSMTRRGHYRIRRIPALVKPRLHL